MADMGNDKNSHNIIDETISNPLQKFSATALRTYGDPGQDSSNPGAMVTDIPRISGPAAINLEAHNTIGADEVRNAYDENTSLLAANHLSSSNGPYLTSNVELDSNQHAFRRTSSDHALADSGQSKRKLKRFFKRNGLFSPLIDGSNPSDDQVSLHDSNSLNAYYADLANLSMRSPKVRKVKSHYFDFYTPGDKTLSPINAEFELISPENFDHNLPTPVAPESERTGPTRRFYDDFTTIDWVHDSLRESARCKILSQIPGLRGKLVRSYDAIQGWIIITIVAFACSILAYCIDISEAVIFDLKRGYCAKNWFTRESLCCDISDPFNNCSDWRTWSEVFQNSGNLTIDFLAYVAGTVIFAYISVTLTLKNKSIAVTADPSPGIGNYFQTDNDSLASGVEPSEKRRDFYNSYGSGVPEVKTILSGFIIRRFLGTYTLINKSVALIFSVSSGMSLGKEGPYVHLATCVGNISCRLFRKFSQNDLKRRQILSAAASAGVALAFGSPLGGVLFSLEEVSYYFLPDQLFRVFFCAMLSALFLKLWDPYKTGHIVLFDVSYSSEWKALELGIFVFLGICGGIFGALFSKFCMWWPKVFRTKKLISQNPKFEVVLIAFITGVTFFNKHTKISVAELLFQLASPCTPGTNHGGLCPLVPHSIPKVVADLAIALLIKIILTCVTFGMKIPVGIYVPSMVIGALFGRIVGLVVIYADNFLDVGLGDIVPGIYAMASAGAFMAGITRMNITVAVILFELTGSLTHVLPFSVAILFANWTAKMIEPFSLYELLIKKNDFPFLDNRAANLSTAKVDIEVGDVITPFPSCFMLDVTDTTSISVGRLKQVLHSVQFSKGLDGSIPLIKISRSKKYILVGLLPALELEYALDILRDYCAFIGIADYDFIKCEMLSDKSNLAKYEHFYMNGHKDGVVPANFAPADQEAASPLPSSTSGPKFFGRGELDEADFATKNIHHTENIDGLTIPAKFTDLTPLVDRSPISIDIKSSLALAQMMFVKMGTRQLCILREGRFVGLLHKKEYIEYTRIRERENI